MSKSTSKKDEGQAKGVVPDGRSDKQTYKRPSTTRCETSHGGQLRETSKRLILPVGRSTGI
jgi:hypothetical protein